MNYTIEDKKFFENIINRMLKKISCVKCHFIYSFLNQGEQYAFYYTGIYNIIFNIICKYNLDVKNIKNFDYYILNKYYKMVEIYKTKNKNNKIHLIDKNFFNKINEAYKINIKEIENINKKKSIFVKGNFNIN